MIEFDYVREAMIQLGERTLVQTECEYMENVNRLASTFERYYDAGIFNGMSELKSELVFMVKGTLDRDPTMQKLMEAVEEM